MGSALPFAGTLLSFSPPRPPLLLWTPPTPLPLPISLPLSPSFFLTLPLTLFIGVHADRGGGGDQGAPRLPIQGYQISITSQTSIKSQFRTAIKSQLHHKPGNSNSQRFSKIQKREARHSSLKPKPEIVAQRTRLIQDSQDQNIFLDFRQNHCSPLRFCLLARPRPMCTPETYASRRAKPNPQTLLFHPCFGARDKDAAKNGWHQTHGSNKEFYFIHTPQPWMPGVRFGHRDHAGGPASEPRDPSP